MLHYTILSYSTLHYIILYYIILHYTAAAYEQALLAALGGEGPLREAVHQGRDKTRASGNLSLS